MLNKEIKVGRRNWTTDVDEFDVVGARETQFRRADAVDGHRQSLVDGRTAATRPKGDWCPHWRPRQQQVRTVSELELIVHAYIQIQTAEMWPTNVW